MSSQACQTVVTSFLSEAPRKLGHYQSTVLPERGETHLTYRGNLVAAIAPTGDPESSYTSLVFLGGCRWPSKTTATILTEVLRQLGSQWYVRAPFRRARRVPGWPHSTAPDATYGDGDTGYWGGVIYEPMELMMPGNGQTVLEDGMVVARLNPLGPTLDESPFVPTGYNPILDQEGGP